MPFSRGGVKFVQFHSQSPTKKKIGTVQSGSTHPLWPGLQPRHDNLLLVGRQVASDLRNKIECEFRVRFSPIKKSRNSVCYCHIPAPPSPLAQQPESRHWEEESRNIQQKIVFSHQFHPRRTRVLPNPTLCKASVGFTIPWFPYHRSRTII